MPGRSRSRRRRTRVVLPAHEPLHEIGAFRGAFSQGSPCAECPAGAGNYYNTHVVVVIGAVERGPEPIYNILTADGKNSVLLNIRSQPDGSTLEIARQLKDEIKTLKNCWMKPLKAQVWAHILPHRSLPIPPSKQSLLLFQNQIFCELKFSSPSLPTPSDSSKKFY